MFFLYFLFVFKEIITLAIGNTNHGGGRDGGLQVGWQCSRFWFLKGLGVAGGPNFFLPYSERE